MQEEDVLPAEVVTNLARRLEEGLRLDIADGAADFGDDDIRAVPVGVRLGHRQDAALDLVGDVRDHLDGVAEVLAAALFGDHGRIDLSGGDIRRAGQVAVEEALVVADVEVSFGAVLGDEDLAVLERVHGAGVDVEVGVELLHRHLQPARGQQLSQAARGQSLTQRRNDATADEEVLGGGLRMLAQCSDLREDGAGLGSLRLVSKLWACRPTETHPNIHAAASSLTRPAGRLDRLPALGIVGGLRRDGEAGGAVTGAVLAGAATVDQVGHAQDRGDSAGLGVHVVDGADHRASPRHRRGPPRRPRCPTDEPSRPASSTPEPCGASAAANRATLTP